ncbi:glycosyltransferase family 39 protein [Corynebacterium sp. YIM 101645]|uniref:Glycosyltransferase family 39 protein n=1 Tax=Corynebacterium lemuris TaxID=1859292 RepID=A0ABT2FTR8_9CORY|nr:glycosyltransferase family 39 protein [Corynebacterium lemuris]
MATTRSTPRLPLLSPVPPTTTVPGFPERRGWRRQADVAFVFYLAVYLVMAVWLALDVGYVLGDALSRTQGALSVLYSRNPDLSVIGFIFTPLTTIAQLPFVALSPWVPELTRAGLAGAVVSALFMAGAVREVWLIAGERNVRHWFAVCATTLFALNPMIVLYGAVGMSEAPFVFATLWATRRLIRWSSTDDVHDLIAAGFALALAFLARYDALVMAFAAMLTVGVLAWLGRRRIGRTDCIGFAVLDMIVLVWPIGLAFLTWTVSSWLTTGELLAQFTSTAGNAAIIAAAGGGATGLPALSEASFRSFLVAPALLGVLAVAVVLSVRRRDPETVFPVVMMLTVIVFQIVTYAAGSTFGLLRFFIAGIPLTIVLLIQLHAPAGRFRSLRPGATYRDRSALVPLTPAVAVTMSALALSGTLLTAGAMTSQKWAPQEFALRQAVPGVDTGTLAEQGDRERVLRTFSTEAHIARHLDAMGLDEGEVLVSTTYGFAVLTASENQRQFVIPSDTDFITVLNRPAQSGVRFLLVHPAEGRGALDPVNLRYPGIYETGSHIATLELEFPNQGEGQPDWRLYRVLSTPDSP